MRVRTEGRTAFAQGLEEIPEGITLVVVSRTDPPPEFARLAASLKIAHIDPAELRCTAEEAEAILGSQKLDREHLQRIQQQSDGWVAALVLLREHLSRRGAALDESLGEGKDAIFQYFAGEIFNGAKSENQRVLMLTAIPPSVTQSEAIALTGSEDAPRLLDYLYRRHLFTDRRRGAETSYHYHALFREFLLEELRKRVPSAERKESSKRAAGLLAGRGQLSDALALFRDVGEWESMRALIHANALDWARQGRAQPVSDWIEALPASMRAADPWLEYWSGRAWIFVQPQRGHPALERAFAAFCAAGDLRGQALSLNTIVTGYYYEWANFAPIDRWLPEFDRLLAEGAPKLDPESELRAYTAWLIALLLRSPEHESVARCAQRLDELIDGEKDLNVRVMAASALFNYINWKTEGESTARLVGRIEPILETVTPLMVGGHAPVILALHRGRYGESTAVMTDARTAERFGLEARRSRSTMRNVRADQQGEHAAARHVDVMERGYLTRPHALAIFTTALHARAAPRAGRRSGGGRERAVAPPATSVFRAANATSGPARRLGPRSKIGTRDARHRLAIALTAVQRRSSAAARAAG
jgi:hypothetical protein